MRRGALGSSRVSWPLAAAAAVAVFASCSRTPAVAPAAAQIVPAASAVVAPPTGGAIPHGDHNPHHGGIVMMKGEDLHYEVVLDRTGRAHHVYFTDAVREDLPAAVASDVALIVHRAGIADERIVMQIDDAGESWIGSGRPVTTPEAASIRLTFAIKHEPYWIDLPFTPSK